MLELETRKLVIKLTLWYPSWILISQHWADNNVWSQNVTLISEMLLWYPKCWKWKQEYLLSKWHSDIQAGFWYQSKEMITMYDSRMLLWYQKGCSWKQENLLSKWHTDIQAGSWYHCTEVITVSCPDVSPSKLIKAAGLPDSAPICTDTEVNILLWKWHADIEVGLWYPIPWCSFDISNLGIWSKKICFKCVTLMSVY